MALSQDIVSQFAKAVNKPEEKKEETIKGTVRIINGKEYVQLDGSSSNIYTPVTSTVKTEDGDRVNVLLQNHAAQITSNITSPSAMNKDVTTLKDEVDEHGNVIKQMDNSITQQGNSIIQMNNTINQQNDILNSYGNVIDQQNNIIQQHGNVIEQHGDNITSMNNIIVSQGNEIIELNNTVESQNNVISLHDNRIMANSNNITLQNNVITAQGSNIQILNSAFVIHDGIVEGLSKIIVDDLDTKYANIEFSNIQIAAISQLFNESGIIKDLVVQEGKITGELVGVIIKGDLIEANTLRADKLVILGEDGLYYKLNIDGLDNISTDQASKFTLTTSKPSNWDTNYTDYYKIQNGKYIHIDSATIPNWVSNTYYKLNSTYESGLDGTNILAHSITADRIQVTDLVAFGATIGGFDIDTHSLHTHLKNMVDSPINGVFLGDDGQMAIGNDNEYIKFYKDQNNNFNLKIQAENFRYGSANDAGEFYVGDDNNYINFHKDENNNYRLDVKADAFTFGNSNKTIKEEMDEIREETTTLLQLESSNGLVFKENQVNTILSVVIYRGADRITDMTTLRNKMGNNVRLQWKWKRMNDSDYGIISSSDSRISNEGFTFTLSPADVDTKVTFLCELII